MSPTLAYYVIVGQRVREADTQMMEDEAEFDTVPVRIAAVELYQFKPATNIRAGEARRPAAVLSDTRNGRIARITGKQPAFFLLSIVSARILGKVTNEKFVLIG